MIECKLNLKTAKEIREFLSLDKQGFLRFVKKNNLTKYPLNERVSRYDFNEVMQVLSANRQRNEQRAKDAASVRAGHVGAIA